MFHQKRFVIAFILLTTFSLLTTNTKACTVFFMFDGKLALGGDNEDWGDPNTQVWVVPGKSDKHAVIYFGFGKGIYPPNDVADNKLAITKKGITGIKPKDLYDHPQQGMNDQGLFFGGAATEVVKRKEFPERIKIANQHLIHKIMQNCGTVKDAIQLLEKYDLGQVQGQWMFGDRKGNAILLEAGNVIVKKQGKSLVMTNFLVSRTPPSKITCPRYQKVTTRLKQEFTSSHKLVRSLLKQTAGKWTQYSTIFDCTHGNIVIYRKGNFEKPTTLNVRQEAKKGKMCMSIAELFNKRSPKSE